MALWGDNDNITTFGTVAVNGTTITGTGTTFTSDVSVGQVIRIGVRGGVGTYYGDAVITGITSDRILTIDTTDGLSATSIAATSYYVSTLPKSSVLDSVFQEGRSDADSLVYGTAAADHDGTHDASSAPRDGAARRAHGSEQSRLYPHCLQMSLQCRLSIRARHRSQTKTCSSSGTDPPTTGTGGAGVSGARSSVMVSRRACPGLNHLSRSPASDIHARAERSERLHPRSSPLLSPPASS